MRRLTLSEAAGALGKIGGSVFAVMTGRFWPTSACHKGLQLAISSYSHFRGLLDGIVSVCHEGLKAVKNWSSRVLIKSAATKHFQSKLLCCTGYTPVLTQLPISAADIQKKYLCAAPEQHPHRNGKYCHRDGAFNV